MYQLKKHQSSEMLSDSIKGIIIVSGVPASGKSYFAETLRSTLAQKGLNSKIFSTDNLEALLHKQQNLSQQQIKKICSNDDWHQFLQSFPLNKQIFNQKIWNLSRKIISLPQILDTLLTSCSILIIQDELPLRSQRKPFKKYCFLKKLKYLEIQIQTHLQNAISNNQERGKICPSSKVSDQVIRKSFQKYEHNEGAVVVSKNTIKQFMEFLDLNILMKQVQIQDNYSERLLKKAVLHEFTEKELDQNELRKLINIIMKDEKESHKYFKSPVQNKEKAHILAKAKKTYIQNKRKIPFTQILHEIVKKESQSKFE